MHKENSWEEILLRRSGRTGILRTGKWEAELGLAEKKQQGDSAGISWIIFYFFFKRKKENHFNKVESQHKEEQQRIQVLHLLEVIKLHQESIKQINTVKKKM